MRIAIVGGGVSGLTAAYEFAKKGLECTIYERDSDVGGLAGSFSLDGVYLEKFYHHLFTSDTEIAGLIAELGLGADLEWKPTVTSYYANRIYRLATPLDVLRFKPLGLFDRFRLGLLAIVPRFVNDWKPLENITVKEWLVRWGGPRVYENVWAPLMRGKFGVYEDQVAAVWIWNKLKLRGGSRGKGQAENLGYLKGGFGRAIRALETRLKEMGVRVLTATPVDEVVVEGGRATGVRVGGRFESYDRVLVTTAPSLFSRLAPGLPADYRDRLNRILYLANTCLIMELDRSLSNTYWLNINDPAIPFVAVVEHTNMQRTEEYGGRHIVYLSRYMPWEDRYVHQTAEELLEAYLPHLRKLFPEFSREWVQRCWSWTEQFAQPVITKRYSDIKPPFRTPVRDLWLCSMAQVYPEDRGMNYAVLYSRRAVVEMLAEL
jgi:protoporphyrinogen oxidase